MNYHEFLKRKYRFGLFILLSLIAFILISISIGSYHLPFHEILAGNPVIMNIRLPRIITAILVGASLAVSGAVMQCVLRNYLASPFTLGISQGAAFGAAFAIIYLGVGIMHRTGEGITILNPYIISLFAFFGSLISVFVILLLSKLRTLSPESMILAGVAMASLFQASTMLMQYFAENEVLIASVVFWTFGDVGRTVWMEISIIFVAFVFSLIYFFYRRIDYNTLLSGDEVALSLGVDVKRIRLEGMLVSSFLTSVCVSFTGIIGFVGLVAPHVVRIIIGGDYRFLILISTLVGALLLLLADTIGRMIISPVVIPVGIVTAFIGAPTFIYLLMRGEVR
jgi:iron complex transport system permease protein